MHSNAVLCRDIEARPRGSSEPLASPGDAELGAAAARPVLQRESEAMVRENLLHEDEAETAAVAFRAEERSEELVAHGISDAVTGVGDGQTTTPQRDADLT